MLIDEGWLATTAGAAGAGAELSARLLEQAARSGKLAARAAAPTVCLKKSRRDLSNGCIAPSIVGGLHRGVKARRGLHKTANCPYISKQAVEKPDQGLPRRWNL